MREPRIIFINFHIFILLCQTCEAFLIVSLLPLRRYIDQVDQTYDDIANLFNNLSEQPDSPSECSQTSLKKRSLISPILNALNSVGSLISCAVQVASTLLNNLLNAVKNVSPNIDGVDLLTDTLTDIASCSDS